MSELDFIEACYEPTASEDEWGAGLAEKMACVVPQALGVMGAAYRVDVRGASYRRLVGDHRFAADPAYAEASRRVLHNVNGARERRALLGLGYCALVPTLTVVSELPPPICATVSSALPWPDSDCIGLFGSFDGRQGYLISPATAGRFHLSRRRRAQLTRLSEHLATGYWLRSLREPGSPPASSVAAVCSPDGRVLHDTGEDPRLSQRLVDAVRGMERARCRRRKRTPEEAAELWQALLAGRYMLVESFERNGVRSILAVRCRAPRPSLTGREAAVVAAAAHGAANKTIAAQLGLATGTVGVHLAAALRKLGCPSRRALAQWLPASRRGAS